VQVLPTGAIDGPAAIAVDAVPDALDPGQLLDVEVDELARSLALIAHGRRTTLELRQPPQVEPATDRTDGRHRHAQSVRDRRLCPPLLPKSLDLPFPDPAYLGRRAVRR
jgi:hypothetical protein